MSSKNKNGHQPPLEERVMILEQKLAELESRLGGGEKKLLEHSGASRKKVSLKEFINEKAPQNARETTLAVASYLENDGIVPFNVQDLEKGFRAGKIPPPKNINDVVNKNIVKGLLMEAKEGKGGRKAWELTTTGEQTVEKGFD